MKKTLFKRGLKAAVVVGGICALIPSVYSQGIGLKKLDEMLIPTPSKLARGATVYQRQCVTCHGDQGTNDTEWARQNGLAQGGFKAGWKNGGGAIQIYNVISAKQEGLEHPVYNYVPYQDRWAVAHYVRNFNPTQQDTAQAREQARVEAVEGVCREELKTSIAERVKPKGEEQLKVGKELYASNCASCHGEAGKGDGAAAAALQPPPRNFVNAEASWTNGTSELAIFGTLANGIAGTSMASYSNLSEDERWALTHYVRNWIPSAKKESSTAKQIDEICKTLSAPPKPEAIPVNMAMKFLVEDAPAQRQLGRQSYGAIYTYNDADSTAGQSLYNNHCAGCHGSRGEGAQPVGPYGAVPPFLYLTVTPLQRNDAGGSYDNFAARSSSGVHATLPDMTGVALISEKEWKDLQSFVGKFGGTAEYISSDVAQERGKPPEELSVAVDSAQAFTLAGEPITREDLSARITELTSTGRRVMLKLEFPANTTEEQLETLRPEFAALPNTEVMFVVTPAPQQEEGVPAPQEEAPAPDSP